MRKLIFSTLSTLAILFLFPTCRKEKISMDKNYEWLVTDQMMTSANFQGYVFDVNFKPVAGATVKAGATSSITNAQGLFFLSSAEVSSTNAVVTISKTGYFTCVKSLPINAGDDHVLKIQLAERRLSGSFSAATGGNINLQSGIGLSIPSNSLIDSVTKQPYTGDVNAYMQWLDPTDPNLLYRMPGELKGITSAGNERALITYGMITVELEGSSGQKLQLSGNAKAKLVFEVPPSLEASAPATIPLWYYDEIRGRWFEEGSAKFVNGKYEGEVKHFTTWNCDYPYDQPMIKFCLKVKDEYDIPYAFVHVMIHRANDTWGGHGFTNANGMLCGFIPANTPLKLDILGEPSCDQSILSKPIGPYSTDIELDSVVVRRDPEKMITVSGTVEDCNGSPLPEGYILSQISYRPTVGKVKDGKFEYNVVRCPADNVVTILSVETATSRYSDPVTKKIAGNKVEVGVVKACGDIYGAMSDWEGNIYRTIKIGNQIWMAENLRTSRFSNGESILNITDKAAWANLSTPAWCNSNNDNSVDAIYGKLYNYFTVSDNRGLAVPGWHIPTVADWNQLFTYLGGYDAAGGKLKAVDTVFWQVPNINATNLSGFSAKGSGFRKHDGDFHNYRSDTWFYSSGSSSTIFGLQQYSAQILNGPYAVGYWNYLLVNSGLSIRLIKD